MKTALKYLTIVGLAIAALIWPSLKVNATEAEDEREATEDIGAREAYRRLQLQDENGQIPPDAWANAYAEKNQMRFLPEAWSEFSSAAQLEAGIQGGNWTSIGPGNLGGRIRSLIVHPLAPNTMWVGAVSGGVWKSTNGGDTWSTNTDFLANLAVNCMAMDATGTDITLYAGTGEGFTNGDAMQGNGIFKSTDGGSHWEQLPSTAVTPTNIDFIYVNRLAVCPTNPQIVLAATVLGIFRSTDGGDHWSQSTGYGLLRNWADVRFRPIPGEPEPDQVDPIDCLASTLAGELYYSYDNGATWQTNATNGLPSPIGDRRRLELAYSRSTPWVVYASTGAVDTNNPSLLLVSEDGGYTFTSLGSPQDPNFPNHGGASWYNNVLWVDPYDPNTVVVGGVFMFRTRDRGAHWEAADSGSHLDHHAIVEHPGYTGASGGNRVAFCATDGGIFRTENILASVTPTPPGGSVTWTSLNSALGVAQFYGAAGHAASGTIIGGTQDNGTVRFQPSGGPENWDIMYGGDGGFCAVDQPPVDPPDFFGEYVSLQIYRNNTGGPSPKREFIWGGPGHENGIPMECRGNSIPCANFTAPFVLDPNNTLEEHRMYAGGRSLWRSTNARDDNPFAVAWPEIKQPVPASGNINAIAVAEGFSDFIWVGYTDDGSVSYTTDGTTATPSWSPGDPNHVLPRRLCTRITIGQAPNTNTPQIAVERTVYVTFGGFFPTPRTPEATSGKEEVMEPGRTSIAILTASVVCPGRLFILW
jgi:photosystem II stability/assembly factor-like uncharacterized protein